MYEHRFLLTLSFLGSLFVQAPADTMLCVRFSVLFAFWGRRYIWHSPLVAGQASYPSVGRQVQCSFLSHSSFFHGLGFGDGLRGLVLALVGGGRRLSSSAGVSWGVSLPSLTLLARGQRPARWSVDLQCMQRHGYWYFTPTPYLLA